MRLKDAQHSKWLPLIELLEVPIVDYHLATNYGVQFLGIHSFEEDQDGPIGLSIRMIKHRDKYYT
jgi:hypothetical protein